MHDVNSTRVLHYGSQNRTIRVWALAAILISASAVPAIPATRDLPIDESVTTSGLDEAGAHELRITTTRPGTEGIGLAARLEEDGGLIQRPVSWTVQRAGAEKIFEADIPIADFVAEPGDYDITASYGAVSITRRLALLAGQHVNITFVLNVGGLRILPRVKGLTLAGIEAETEIYLEGRRIARSTLPGEVLRVGAGNYRIVSRFAHGNVEVVANARVKPGRMNAISIDHLAGIAKIKFADDSAAAAEWIVTDTAGRDLPPATGANAVFVLKPGAYQLRGHIHGETHNTQFDISAGEICEIRIGQ